MRKDMLWSGWGDQAEAMTLPHPVVDLLRTALGVRSATPPVPLSDVRLPESRLSDAARARFAAIVGAQYVHSGDRARLLHTRGRSTLDLLRIRSGEADDAPDAVVLAGSEAEVLELLRVCVEERVAVVPFGGGTSVVGGLEPAHGRFPAAIALDLCRLNRLVEFDEYSRIATLEPGLRGPEAEALVGEHGYTIGHHPQSFEFATIGGFAAARSSGQASAGYGRFDERVVRLRVATPRGILELGRAPKTAGGPDLRQLFLGSEGALGVITAVSVEVQPLPAARVYEGWRIRSFADGMQALRRLLQDGPVPTVLRLSDEPETALNLARPAEIGADPSAGGCLAITGYEGTEADVDARRAGATEILRAIGAEPEAGAGEAWLEGRYRAPYLRDALLDAGALVETLETACFWSGLEPLYRDVAAALRETLSGLGTPPVVLCHISHVYRSGASLYYTIGAAQLEDPLTQWRAAKRAAGEAIVAAGGTITHHHGVGSDHRELLKQEIGPLGVELLRALKAALDPTGIMNPGILIA